MRGSLDVRGSEASFAVLRAARNLETHLGQVEDLKQLTGHRRLETTLVHLRRRRRRRSMETVRDLDWDNSGIPQNAPKLLESLPLTEKEGFEPSMEVSTPITP
jgi:hypothetical protein